MPGFIHTGIVPIIQNDVELKLKPRRRLHLGVVGKGEGAYVLFDFLNHILREFSPLLLLCTSLQMLPSHCKNYPGELTEVTISTFLILLEWRIPW